MEETSDSTNHIKSWLSNKYNIALLVILILALVIRLYYFSFTINQPLWWDEAEYMLKAKSFVFGTPTTGWAAQREVVVPIFWGILEAIEKSEILPRFFQVIVSLTTVFFTYLIGKELYNKKVGLIAGLIMSVNAINLFFTVRLLTYIWAPLFFTLFFYSFIKFYIQKQSRTYLYLTAFFGALGISVYSSMAFGILAVVMFLLITEQHRIFKKKEIWLVLILGVIFLLPYLIYNQVNYGSFASRYTSLAESPKNVDFSKILDYVNMGPHLFGNPNTGPFGAVFPVLIAVGFFYFLFKLLLSFDFVVKNRDDSPKKELLILLWALAVLGFYTYISVSYGTSYDAFIVSSFPALAILGASAILLLYHIPLKRKYVTILIILILAYGSYSTLTYANPLIKNKIGSYDSVKYGGEWIKENSEPGDIVVSVSLPQNTYYSERYTYSPGQLGKNLTEFDKNVSLIKPKFFVVSIWEQTPEWVYKYPQEKNLTPVQAYFLDQQKTQPSLVIYKINP